VGRRARASSTKEGRKETLAGVFLLFLEEKAPVCLFGLQSLTCDTKELMDQLLVHNAYYPEGALGKFPTHHVMYPWIPRGSYTHSFMTHFLRE